MVYLNLSVNSIEEAIDFYSVKLALFTAIPSVGRLIFDAEADLIIDLQECGSERHLDIFGRSEFSKTSFWVSIGSSDRNYKLPIFKQLKEHNIEYTETNNLGGHKLYFHDPSGNRFVLGASGRVFL